MTFVKNNQAKALKAAKAIGKPVPANFMAKRIGKPAFIGTEGNAATSIEVIKVTKATPPSKNVGKEATGNSMSRK